jgi:hypothetical protein
MMVVEAEKLVSIHSGGACAAAVERSKGPLEFSMVERPASTTLGLPRLSCHAHADCFDDHGEAKM